MPKHGGPVPRGTVGRAEGDFIRYIPAEQEAAIAIRMRLAEQEGVSFFDTEVIIEPDPLLRSCSICLTARVKGRGA